MCRFVGYKGNPITVADLLIRSENSLIVQSIDAKESIKPVNGDGFGLGWYPEHSDPEPGVFTSIEPAWSNRNLRRLSEKIVTSCFFAHVRDATIGMPVTELNCHPFRYGNYLWMHNGFINSFKLIRRRLMKDLSDDAFNLIEGNTDSEFSFAYFLNQIGLDKNASADTLGANMMLMIENLRHALSELEITAHSMLNFAMTDGENIILTRATCGKIDAAPSLYYSETDDAVIFASEPLSKVRENWRKLPTNSVFVIDKNNSIEILQL
ncbi:class II glutamine amidotransferase [Pseudemcibacter aquimaris]|uniref:class II glutamine amidotransferase n=1 Tax=Pseudemcibacter aquimaris TaxID=2857064 RepID=UPI002011B407|nr:class II glutamine amidotransferase [Pseudemcibacter aquimaris]MCC3860125.1 class II glutamine amidotransferase [Pseudemcibacter aquimaris]WDU57452.1 class II glutamine amidotransferase [Pseudemcibacter aquimaris]